MDFGKSEIGIVSALVISIFVGLFVLVLAFTGTIDQAPVNPIAAQEIAAKQDIAAAV